MAPNKKNRRAMRRDCKTLDRLRLDVPQLLVGVAAGLCLAPKLP